MTEPRAPANAPGRRVDWAKQLQVFASNVFLREYEYKEPIR
jgi:hypothetical protein